MSEGQSPLEAIIAQDKTQREIGNHTRNHYDRVSLLQFQCHLQEGRHPIYRSGCLGEEEMKGRGGIYTKLLKSRSSQGDDAHGEMFQQVGQIVEHMGGT